MHGKKSTRWHWISLPLKHTEQTIYKESRNGSFQGFFQLLTLDKWGKINWHHWKECLKISNIAKFESDLLNAMKILLLKGREILQMFLWWGKQNWPPPPPPYKVLFICATLGSHILAHLRRITFTFGNFTNFMALSVVSTDFP